LICTSGGTVGSEYPLLEGDVTFGRSVQNDIQLLDIKLSRYHAKISCNNGIHTLVDLNSTNGIKLNGTKIIGSAQLSKGDIIKIGSTEYEVWETVPSDEASTDSADNAADDSDKNLLETTTLQVTDTVSFSTDDLDISPTTLSFFTDDE